MAAVEILRCDEQAKNFGHRNRKSAAFGMEEARKRYLISFSQTLYRRHPLVPSRTATAEARCQGVSSRREPAISADKISLITIAYYRDVAQFGRALRSGRRSRRFESCHLDQNKKTLWGLFLLLGITGANLSTQNPSPPAEKEGCKKKERVI